MGQRGKGNEEGRRAELLAYELTVGRHGHERERADEQGVVRDRSVEQIASLVVRAEQVEVVHPATLQVSRPLFRRTPREEPGGGRQPAACNDGGASVRLVESVRERVAVHVRVELVLVVVLRRISLEHKADLAGRSEILDNP